MRVRTSDGRFYAGFDSLSAKPLFVKFYKHAIEMGKEQAEAVIRQLALLGHEGLYAEE